MDPMDPLWTRYGPIEGHIMDHYGPTMDPLWTHSMDPMDPLRTHYGPINGPIKDPLWTHYGHILRARWTNKGPSMDPLRTHEIFHSVPPRSDMCVCCLSCWVLLNCNAHFAGRQPDKSCYPPPYLSSRWGLCKQ
jgi:hypothetical protein